MPPHIVMLCSLDTKGREAEYLKDRIEQLGAEATLIDVGYGRPSQTAASVTAADVARAAGTDIASVYATQDTGAASTLMMTGATVIVQDLFRRSRCDGLIAFGGASNTTLATGVMRTLPTGVPKFVISSAAAMPAYAAKYFGSKDITIMHSVVDLSGLNEMTRRFLALGAAAVCGMAAVAPDAAVAPRGGRLVAVTSFRFAEECSQAVVQELERRGYSPIPFHAQGVGEDAMEDLIAEGLFTGVIDVVPAGLSERLFGGNRAARRARLEAAGRAGIPHVIATSGFDMISCGPIERRDAADPLWEELGLASRPISIPDRFRVEARTTSEEVEQIARLVADKLNARESAAAVLVPTRGWSSLSVAGAELFDPEADAVFAPALRSALTRPVEVREVDAELNSTEFGAELVDALDRMLAAGEKARGEVEESS
jgi:uncharacterized protein (UPF0261 family)